MEYEEAVRFIFGFTNYEFTPLAAAPSEALRLDRIRALLARLGDPQRGRHTVHITGSKGKGSTACMLAALLAQDGGRVGLFTSPHLHSPRERIMIDGAALSEEDFARLTSQLRPHVEAANQLRPGDALTTFELLTALAFLAFRELGCAWQAVEVGIGGRLDATNVLDEKDLCVFTPISLEHTAILGSTTAAIAADKAGILRPGCRAVLAPQDEAPEAVLLRACAELGVPAERVSESCTWQREPFDLDGQQCRMETARACYDFWLPLLGSYQVENAATAILALENVSPSGVPLTLSSASGGPHGDENASSAPGSAGFQPARAAKMAALPALQRKHFQITPEAVAQAFASLRWPGRLEVLSGAPLIIVDGAHNAASARRLAEALAELCSGRRLTLVLGTLADKDLTGIVEALAPLAAEVITVQADLPRARDAAEIALAFEKAGVPARAGGSVAAGLREALAVVRQAHHERQASDAICVAGSLYVVAEARAALLGITQEPLA